MIPQHADAPEALGRRIARLRQQRGWTQEDLAARLAVSRVAVSHYEAGLALPSERTVLLLAGLFKTTPHELIADTSYPPAKAERLPAVACCYTEVELQLALLERDLEWCARLDAATHTRTVAAWRVRLQHLVDATYDAGEQNLLRAALARLEKQSG